MTNTDNSLLLRRQFLAHVGQTSPAPMLVEVARSEGVFFYTPEGKRYYDLIAGVSVSGVGHANPEVVEAVRRQAGEYMHVMVYGELVERPQTMLAARLAGLLPGGIDSVYFVNSGSEAIEGALQLARRATGRTQALAMRDAYHGSTAGAVGLDRTLVFNDMASLALIGPGTAAVFVEPVQGEAGVRTARPEWLRALRERCSQEGALLVFDEIQTGLGRTGRMFASEHTGVVPDVVCLAKALGGGMPLGAFAARRALMGALSEPALGYITTFGGHPVCCAAGLAGIQYLLRERLVEQVEAKGALFEELLGAHPAVREIRRAGLLMAVEVGTSEKLFRLMELFKEAGILSDWFLHLDTAFRVSPPLTITEAEIRDSARVVGGCLDQIL